MHTISSRTVDTTDVVDLVEAHGSLDGKAIDELERELWARIGHGGTVVIDMRGAVIADAARISNLLRSVAELSDLSQDPTAILVVASAAGWRILKGHGADGAFALCRTLEEALGQVLVVD